MEVVPVIASITDLRRDACGLIDEALATHAPVFITQRGHWMAVLLSRELYDALLRDQASDTDTDGAGAGERGGETQTRGQKKAKPSLPRGHGKAKPSLPRVYDPWERVDTPWGCIDPATAAFLKERGAAPNPYLSEDEKRRGEAWQAGDGRPEGG